MCLIFRFAQGGQQHGCENGDDRDHDQQFDQSESGSRRFYAGAMIHVAIQLIPDDDGHALRFDQTEKHRRVGRIDGRDKRADRATASRRPTCPETAAVGLGFNAIARERRAVP